MYIYIYIYIHYKIRLFFAEFEARIGGSRRLGRPESVESSSSLITAITTISRIAIITTISRIFIITTINRIAIIATINRIAISPNNLCL